MMRLVVSAGRLLSLGLLVVAHGLDAGILGVIDSGLDTSHSFFQNRLWVNPGEIAENGADDDLNDVVDDIHGWNFVEQNGVLIDRKYKSLHSKEKDRFFEIQARALMGTATEEEKTWAKERREDKDFVKGMFTYGNYIHGTHVAGIGLPLSSPDLVLGLKIIPTENPFLKLQSSLVKEIGLVQSEYQGQVPNWLIRVIIKKTLADTAKVQGDIFGPLGQYLGRARADVANASLGVGRMQIEPLLKAVLKLFKIEEADPIYVQESVTFFLNEVLKAQQQLFLGAPDTLFVFAAGNDHEDNDTYPTAPASIDHPHSISVGASFESGAPAPFSNYGAKSVDIFAPGVGIVSPIPDERTQILSGTSQAAPQVARVALEVKAINPGLSPTETKTLLLGTVDKVAELKGLAVSEGVLNAQRAVYAAKLSLKLGLNEAIRRSLVEVRDAIGIATDAPFESEWIQIPGFGS